MDIPTAELFGLDPAVVHLDHGAFGAVPVRVRETQRRWQRAADRNPHRFHLRVLPALVADARSRAAHFLGVDEDDTALITNATEALSIVLAAQDMQPGGEIIVSNHGYGAVRLAAERIAARTGSRVFTAEFPVGASDDTVVAAYTSHMSPRTRLVVVDQITSPTATVLPVERIANASSAPVLVDAAHAPGTLDVDIASLGADYWVGDLHKWAYAARGTAVLWTSPGAPVPSPIVLGWSLLNEPRRRLDEAGTRDLSSWLALGDGLDLWHELGGWGRVAEMSGVVERGRRLLSAAWNTEEAQLPFAPAPTMRLVQLPEAAVSSDEDVDRLIDVLSESYAIECAPKWFGGRGYVRLAAGPYTTVADFEWLADALPRALGRTARRSAHSVAPG
ncbi:aminotransferase class V-fold PLP-dependent enzyme [Streptomyces sp. SID8361]|uniref:aminotransferase class V-fold PLP-dependent enzyme n=1 Tax=Streptomyces sp. MnatMP-M27 TaxID=1839768 RepID=UPI00081D82F4|nr:aminotransferase class V-fold PLP-dependent enzyme [Streptomyces sp. MnatMP-M27]MYU10057.1 aminotransferase class V-fold PLP-dependent enzyme [Streptomyces sp. SID8361]SCF67925.1 isopenicillin-N epimerase [Streptomyces sp. MnatMP-M27]